MEVPLLSNHSKVSTMKEWSIHNTKVYVFERMVKDYVYEKIANSKHIYSEAEINVISGVNINIIYFDPPHLTIHSENV
jgi:hypothetical protein